MKRDLPLSVLDPSKSKRKIISVGEKKDHGGKESFVVDKSHKAVGMYHCECPSN